MIYKQLRQYTEAMDTLVRAASVFSAVIQTQDSDAYERLMKYWDAEVTTNAAMLSARLNLIAENIRSYMDAMTGYIAPVNYGAQIRVDRNDIWFNYVQIHAAAEGYLDILSDTGSSREDYRRNFYYNPLESEASNNARRDRMHREDHEESCRRGRNYNKLAGFRSEMHQRLSEDVSAQISKIKEIHDDRIIPYENTDDEYCKKLRELCDEWIILGDRIRENGKETLDIYRGGFAALLDLIVGVLGLIKGVAEWQSYSLCGDWGWAPEWLETDINRMKQGVKLIFTDPGQVLETIGQNIFDTVDEEGIAYSVGYVTVDIALEILVDKGLDKLKTLNKADDVIGIAEDTARGIGAEYTITYAEVGEDFVKSVENIADAAEDLSQYAYTAEAAGEGLLQHLDDVDDISRAENGVVQGGRVAENGTSALDDVAEGTVNGSIVSESGTSTFKYKEVKIFTADETNQWFIDNVKPDYKPPYKPGTIVKEIELTENTTFVRVYDNMPDGSGMYGSWVMKAEDIEGLTPLEIQNKFALPNTPKYVCDVELDAGTHIRVGEVNPLDGWGTGGGTQYDLIGQRIGDFKNERLLEGN